MTWTAQLLRLMSMPVAMGLFLLAAQASGGLVVRAEVSMNVAPK